MKTVRQQRILELIQMHDIEKQEELVQMLCEDGFDVTQATVSRDISQLRLKKVSGKNGKLVYKAAESKHQQAEPKYLRILKESYVSMDMAMNILVIKTVSGMAWQRQQHLMRVILVRLSDVLQVMIRLCARFVPCPTPFI